MNNCGYGQPAHGSVDIRSHFGEIRRTAVCGWPREVKVDFIADMFRELARMISEPQNESMRDELSSELENLKAEMVMVFPDILSH